MPVRSFFVVLALCLGGCVAPPPPVINVAAPAASLAERLTGDEERILEGARLGQFTTPEYNALQGRHAAIENTRRQQLAQGGGQFAPGQYEALVGREDVLSRTIFDYRHNGATPTAH